MTTVLVSGASGIIGYGILRSLRKTGRRFKLISTTIYDDSVAKGFSDIFELAPLTSDPNYIEWLISIIEKHNVDIIFPGIEADMYKWAQNAQLLSNSRARIVLNNLSLISLCNDKWVFYEKLIEMGYTHRIDTYLDSDFEFAQKTLGLPFLLKPRCGHGSKGIVRIENEETFLQYKNSIGNSLMVQPIIGTNDKEFTTSAFCDGEGGYFSFITLKRTLSGDGFTEKAEVVSVDGMEEAMTSLCEIFKPIGPTNFQFRQDKEGLKLLEINPRISSSTSLRTAFGYNEALMAVDYFIENKIPEEPVICQGKAVRYVEDFIYYL
jgi:carbamoyl-phosphate synthase large subunit